MSQRSRWDSPAVAPHLGRRSGPVLLLAGVLVTALHAQAPSPVPPLATTKAPLVFRGVTVIDVRTGRRLADQAVTIVDRRIEAVVPVQQARMPPGAQVVDARGRYLVPGFWDMHVHPHQYVDLVYPLLIANGVTGVRDAGSEVPLATLNQWKREVVAGTRVGPRHLVSGPAIDEARDSTQHTVVQEQYQFVSVPQALAAQVVDSLHAAGADFIKTYGLSRPMHLAMAAEARRVGILFGGHSWNVPGLEISDSGATFLDHDTWFNPFLCGFGHDPGVPDSISLEACTAAARRLRRNNTWITLIGALDTRARIVARIRRYVPASFPNRNVTLADSEAAIPDPTSTAEWQAYVTRQHESWLDGVLPKFTMLHAAGMPILVGTDANLIPMGLYYGLTPGFFLHQVLEFFVVGGMTPLEALQTVTLNPALALRATDSLGTVEAGKAADLVLLDGDPLADIWNTTKIRAVVANGRYYDRTALDRLLVDAEQAAARR